MSKWSSYYQNRVGSSYPIYCRDKYAPFIDEILSEGIFIREEGCGIGTISRVIGALNDSILLELMDIDIDMLSLADKNLINCRIKKIFKGDIRMANVSSVDVIFSHGVLEHFSNDSIGKIIHRQRALSKKVIHYVPTNRYSKKSFGDERLRSATWWISRFSPKRFLEFNEGKDLMLIW